MTEFQALLLSVAIESPLAWLLVTLTGWPSRGAPHAALAAAIASAVTHPQLWAFVTWATPGWGWWPATLAGETAVVAVEAALIAWAIGLRPVHALMLSLVTNAASFAFGLLLLLAA